MPPATKIGTSPASSGNISCARTLVETGPIWPPASIPSITSASTPERTSFFPSASVGVSALGSLSLPIGSSDDSLVKVASATLQDPNFYKRFFSVLERFLPEDIERPAKPSAATQAQPTLFPVLPYPQPVPAELPAEQAALPDPPAAEPSPSPL